MNNSEQGINTVNQANNLANRMLTGIKNNILIVLGGVAGGVAAHHEAVTVFNEFSQLHGTTTNDLLGVFAGALIGGTAQYYLKRN